MKKEAKTTFQFSVPCSYYYEIEAKSEEEARKILMEKGGIDLEGDLLLNENDYQNADCIGELR